MQIFPPALKAILALWPEGKIFPKASMRKLLFGERVEFALWPECNFCIQANEINYMYRGGGTAAQLSASSIS